MVKESHRLLCCYCWAIFSVGLLRPSFPISPWCCFNHKYLL